MSHYFTNNPERTENRKEISFRFLTNLESFVSDDGVFSKSTLDFGSRVLLETLLKQPIRGKVLDLGCGIGYIGILLHKYRPDIELTMSDVNETAVKLAEENSRRYGQNNKVLVSDGFEAIEEDFDVIITNPPIRAGKKVIYSMFDQSYRHLREQGCLYIVIRQQQGAPSAINFLKAMSDETKVIEKKNGYWIIVVKKV